MFDLDVAIGLSEAGESHDDDWVYRLTCAELSANWSEPDRHVLPAGLEVWVPGVFQAAVADSVDRTRLNGHDAVRLMQAEARLASHFEAGKLATMSEVAHSPGGGPGSPVERDASEVEYASDEIAAALSLTRRDADQQLGLAWSLSGPLRRVWERFRRGVLDLAKVKVFDRQIGHLTAENIDMVCDRILDDTDGLTTGQLQARLARLVMEVDPEGVDIGYQEGLADRRFVSYANPDNTGTVAGQSLAAPEVAAIARRVDKIARRAKTADDPRTMDQIRADVFVDLLMGRTHASPSDGGVHLDVGLATLARLSDTPGELAGFGPVIADIARQTASSQTEALWTYTVTDDDGEIVHTGVTRRRASAAIRRRVEAEYQTCVFVGCRMPAYDCDLDHRRPFSQGGPTHQDNEGPLCRHHHMAKHHALWLLERKPNGDHQWTSPLGHVYVKARAPPGQ